MDAESQVLMVEDRFFLALLQRDMELLEDVVADDCVLIDVLTGSEVPRAVFVELVGSQKLVFDSIERLDVRARLYGTTAVVTGETQMIGRFDAKPFRVHSRYTHVYAQGTDGFRLVNAQGTPVTALAA
jgi:ketosteroid isomerase-like protein